jgi:hypothetical protein
LGDDGNLPAPGGDDSVPLVLVPDVSVGQQLVETLTALKTLKLSHCILLLQLQTLDNMPPL